MVCDNRMSIKYSVIVPVYNSETTIRRCVDSLLAERYEDAEIILVNDGSKDSSGEICESFASEYSNIIYICKENGGVSTARNAGLDAAIGRYVLFEDSDDYVKPGFFHTVDEVEAKFSADLIQFSYTVFNGHEEHAKLFSPLNTSSREQMIPHVVNAICRKTLNSPWGKLYRRDLIESHHIRFPVGASIAEDRVFNIKYSMYIKSYAVSEKMVCVVSTENENSLSRGRYKDEKQQLEIAEIYLKDALQYAPITEMEKQQYLQAVNFGTCRSIYHDAKLMHQDQVEWKQRHIQLIKLCNEMNRKRMRYPKTLYCNLITLPVRWRLTPVIDAIAWKLTR